MSVRYCHATTRPSSTSSSSSSSCSSAQVSSGGMVLVPSSAFCCCCCWCLSLCRFRGNECSNSCISVSVAAVKVDDASLSSSTRDQDDVALKRSGEEESAAEATGMRSACSCESAWKRWKMTVVSFISITRPETSTTVQYSSTALHRIDRNPNHCQTKKHVQPPQTSNARTHASRHVLRHTSSGSDTATGPNADLGRGTDTNPVVVPPCRWLWPRGSRPVPAIRSKPRHCLPSTLSSHHHLPTAVVECCCYYNYYYSSHHHLPPQPPYHHWPSTSMPHGFVERSTPLVCVCVCAARFFFFTPSQLTSSDHRLSLTLSL